MMSLFFQSREHKINTLMKENRETAKTIERLTKRFEKMKQNIINNNIEIARLRKEKEQ